VRTGLSVCMLLFLLLRETVPQSEVEVETGDNFGNQLAEKQKESEARSVQTLLSLSGKLNLMNWRSHKAQLIGGQGKIYNIKTD